MNHKSILRNVLPIVLTLAITALAVIALGQTYPSVASKATLFDSPLPTPTPQLPIPTPTSGPSQAAQAALAYIANREGIPANVLSIVADHPTEYPNLGRQFQVITVLDTRPQGQVYKLLVDLRSGQIEEDVSALLAAEARAHQARYGKLQPALYERLQTLHDDEPLPVAVWVAAGTGQSLAEQQAAAFATLAARYPEVREAIERFGKPMDVSDPALRQRVEDEYIALLATQPEMRTRLLITELERRGFTITAYTGMPSFTAILPKRVILELAHRPEVSAIYLVEAEAQPELDSAVPTSLAPVVWARGYDGNGVTIAILEHGNVDPNNNFLHLSPISRAADNGVQDHTTRVASDAASFHGTYRGMAYGATVLSAGHMVAQTDFVAGLQWAFDQGASIVNVSEGYEADNTVNWLDRAVDYWARSRFRAVVKSAGNTGGSITTPGKAWNTTTVGAIDDNNNPNWPEDRMWSDSAYVNPVSPHNDREKPEVVAVGANVTALGVGNVPQTGSGTSHAAPQVAGLVALLIHRNAALNYWPEAAKAIIMASATHNITGPTTILLGQGDLRDGAGAINAALADNVAQLRADDTTTCYVPCWWGCSVDNNNFPVGTDLERTFYADQGDLIRVTIAWWANADTPGNNYSFDRLDTDLDLRIKGPDNQYIPSVSSLSWDNNYEMVEFAATQSGVYKIAVRKVRADELVNYLGIAFVRLHRVYIPAVLRTYNYGP
jgi:hypothetical protein